MGDDSNKRIAKNTLFLYIRMAFVLCVTLYTSRILLQYLGVVDYGVFNIVAGFVSMFSFINTSLSNCTQRFYNYENGTKGVEGIYRVFSNAIVTQLLLTVIVFSLVETVGLWYLNNKLVIPADRLHSANILFHSTVCSMVLIILQVPFSALVMAKEKMDFYAYIGMIDVVLKVIIILLLPYMPFDKLVSYGLMLLSISLFDLILYVWYSSRFLTGVRSHLSLDKDLFVSMIKFSGWGILGTFAQVVRNQGLNVILNIFFGPIVNAARGISYQVQGALTGFISSISTAARPQITESYAQNDIERSEKLMFSISKICFFLLLILALPVILNIDYLLLLWLGPNVPDYASVFSVMILVITLIDVFSPPVSILIYATGDISWYNIVTSALGLLSLPVAFFVLKLGSSPISVYIVSLVISVLVQTASVIILQKTVRVKISNYLRRLVVPCLAVLILSFPLPYYISSLIEEGFLKLFISTVISSIVILCLCFTCGLNQNEKQLCKSYVNRFLNTIGLSV